jgi:heptosyltransferase-3
MRPKLSIVGFCLRSCNILLLFTKRLLYAKPGQPARILIFRTGSLGDNLCAIPSIAAVHTKFPQAKIDILTNAGKANLVTLEKILPPAYYDRIIDYFGYSRKALVSLLRQGNYDLIIYLPQVDASMFTLMRDLIFFRLFSRSGFGWTKSMIPLFRRTQEKNVVFPNEISRLSSIMSRNGVAVPEGEIGLYSTGADQQLVDDYFVQNGLTDKRKNIAMVVGAKRPQNRWPLSNFKAVAGHFHGQYNILVIGGPEDKALAASLIPLDRVFDLCGRFTPIQSSLALRNCLLTLSNDTGPMHLSYAVGTPTIALFSSRDLPGKWYPPDSPVNKVFRTAGVPCSACFSETCNNNICMKAIQPSAVIQTMEDMIKTLSN